MKFYFCIVIPWENTYIEEYDTLVELKKDWRNYMVRNYDWYVIKGEDIEVDL